MAAISGLQSPNPYAQPATRASTRTRLPAEGVPDQAISHHPSYSPDWMQADHASAAQTASAGIYGMKGELQKLPPLDSAANEPAPSSSRVADNVTLSVDYGSLPGSGKPSPQ